MKTIALTKERASVKDYISLTKMYLSLAIGIPGLFAYLLVAPVIGKELPVSLVAMFLLAMGVCALNQYQERAEDAKMPRTQKRPLVTGRISEKEALSIIAGLIVTSMVMIYPILGLTGIGLFASVIILYNGLYTGMKKINAYAVIPGAVLGVIPPLVTWLAAGGDVTEPRFIAIAWFYFIWQMPHFWLLVMVYHKDYAKGGFPTMIDVVGGPALARITLVWTLMTIVSALAVVSYFLPVSNWILGVLLAHSLFFAYKAMGLLKENAWDDKKQCKKLFMQINLYVFLSMGFLSLDRWVF